MDVENVERLHGHIVGINLSPYLDDAILNVTELFLLVHVKELDLSVQLLVENSSDPVGRRIVSDVVVIDVQTLRLYLHRKALSVFSKVPDEEPVVLGEVDAPSEGYLLILVDTSVVGHEVLKHDIGHVHALLGIQKHSVLVQNSLDLDLTVVELRRDGEVQHLTEVVLPLLLDGLEVVLTVDIATNEVLVHRNEQSIVVDTDVLLLLLLFWSHVLLKCERLDGLGQFAELK